MKYYKTYITLSVLSFASMTSHALPNHKPTDVKVKINTNMGNIVLQLDQKKAPNTVKNFLAYAKSGHYNGTIFHRVINNFMIQGGGFTQNMVQKNNKPAIKNEAYNGLKNNKGTIAMARTGNPHSATSQFFINTKNNNFLNHKDKTQRGWGYTVFGKVIQGMNVVNDIQTVKTGRYSRFSDVPKKPIIIQSITIVPVK